jgi:hypothetical protein
MSFEIRFLIGLAMTVAVETTVLFVFIRVFWKINSPALSGPRCIFAGMFASCATMPYLWFILPAFVKPYIVMIVAGELCVTVAEAVFYYFVLNISMKRAIVLSVAANGASIVAGLAVLR